MDDHLPKKKKKRNLPGRSSWNPWLLRWLLIWKDWYCVENYKLYFCEISSNALLCCFFVIEISGGLIPSFPKKHKNLSWLAVITTRHNSYSTRTSVTTMFHACHVHQCVHKIGIDQNSPLESDEIVETRTKYRTKHRPVFAEFVLEFHQYTTILWSYSLIWWIPYDFEFISNNSVSGFFHCSCRSREICLFTRRIQPLVYDCAHYHQPARSSSCHHMDTI